MQRQTLSQENKLQRWYNTFLKKTGYFVFNAGSVDKEIVNYIKNPFTVPEKDKREWEFRIAILPTPLNLNLAAQVLTEIFRDEKYAGIDFKCLALNDSDRVAEQLISWDGVSSAGNDSDDRGKEVCVSMSYNPEKQQYNLTPEQYKELMLLIWRRFIEARIKGIGYAFCPSGDKPLPTEYGLQTPFSYSAYKPATGEHGILFESDYNPHHHADPLKGVFITKADLIGNGIPLEQAKFIYEYRIANASLHIEESEKCLAMKLQDIKNKTAANGPNRLKEFVLEIITKYENAQNIRISAADISTLEEVAHYLPYKRNKLLIDYFNNDVLTPARSGKTMTCIYALQNIFSYIENDRHRDIQAIINDFLCPAGVLEAGLSMQEKEKIHIQKMVQVFLQYERISDEMLRNMIDLYPHKMQILFRQIVHHLREFEAYKNLTSLQNKSAHYLQILCECIIDSDFWIQQTLQKKSLPDGIEAMQKIIKNLPIVNGNDLGNVFKKLFDIANARTSGLKLGLFTRGDKTGVLYSILIEMSGKDNLLDVLESNKFQQFLKEWKMFNSIKENTILILPQRN